MRDCLDEGTLRSYLDAELPRKRMEAVAAHLSSCRDCANSLREVQENSSIIAEAFVPVTSMSIPAAQIRERLNSAIAKSHMRPMEASTTLRSRLKLLTFTSSMLPLLPRYPIGFTSYPIIIILAVGLAFLYWQFSTDDGAEEHASSSSVNSTFTQNSVEELTPRIATAQSLTNDSSSLNSSTASSPTKSTTRKWMMHASRDVALERRKASPKPTIVAVLLLKEKKFQDAISQVTSVLNPHENTAMEPSLRVEYERNIAVVDMAISVTRRAALRNPHDPEAIRFLLSAYQSKLDFLNAFVAQTQIEIVEN